MDWLNEPYGYFLFCNSHRWGFHTTVSRLNTQMNTRVLDWPVLVMEHWIPVRWLHPCPLQQCQHLLQGQPIDSASVTDRKRLMTTLASGRQERNWHISGVERERWGYFHSVHLWMQGKAICVACPRDSSAAPPRLSEREGGEASCLFLLLWKTTLPSRLMLLPWCWAVLGKRKRAKTVCCCQHNWERCNYFSLPLSHWSLFACCLLATKNSFVQTSWQHLILDLGCKK